MSLLPFGGRETGLSYEGLSSIADYYNIPYISPGWNNSQYESGGLVSPEDPFGGDFDILPDSEPEPLLTKPVSALAAISPLTVGVALLVLGFLFKYK